MKYLDLIVYDKTAKILTSGYVPVGIIFEKSDERKLIRFKNFENDTKINVIDDYCEDFTVYEMCMFKTMNSFIFQRMPFIFIPEFIESVENENIPDELKELIIDYKIYELEEDYDVRR